MSNGVPDHKCASDFSAFYTVLYCSAVLFQQWWPLNGLDGLKTASDDNPQLGMCTYSLNNPCLQASWMKSPFHAYWPLCACGGREDDNRFMGFLPLKHASGTSFLSLEIYTQLRQVAPREDATFEEKPWKSKLKRKTLVIHRLINQNTFKLTSYN